MTNASAEVQLLLTAKDEASRVLKGVEGSANSFGKTLGDVGKIAGGFIAANVMVSAAGAVTNFVGGSIKEATRLGESLNAVNKIFGSSAQTVLDWGKQNATSFGLSQQSFNELATPMGAVLKNLGFSQDQVADKTINLTKRAADLASVFNTDVDEALSAINSALRGEANPIERYGVSVNAAAVELRALADTGKTTAASLTENEKASARLAIIFDQTASSAGDFADTSKELANAARIQKARQEELQAQIGGYLVPIMLKWTEVKAKLVELIATKLIPLLEELWSKHGPAITKAFNDVVSFFQTNWPLISAVVAFVFDFVATKVQGFIQVMGAIIEIVTSVVNLVSDLFHGRWSQAWGEMKDIAGAMIDLLVGTIKYWFGNIPGIIMGLLGDLAGSVGRVFSGIASAAERALRLAVNNIIDLINQAIRAYNSLPLAGDIGQVSRLHVPYDISGGGGYSPGDLAGEYASGTSYVPRTAAYLLHQGEAVIPANQNNMGGVNFYGSVTINARDRLDAERGAGDFAFGLSAALRTRGIP